MAHHCLDFVQLFSRKAAKLLYSNQKLQRWCFDVELLFLAQKCGVPVSEIAVTWTEIPGKNVTSPRIPHIHRLTLLHMLC